MSLPRSVEGSHERDIVVDFEWSEDAGVAQYTNFGEPEELFEKVEDERVEELMEHRDALVRSTRAHEERFAQLLDAKAEGKTVALGEYRERREEGASLLEALQASLEESGRKSA